MSLTLADVEKVALLARLRLAPAELESFASQLGGIVGYVELLQELNTSGVEPLAHAVAVQNVFADDIPAPSLPREVALANAPKQDGECFRVPAVLGDG